MNALVLAVATLAALNPPARAARLRHLDPGRAWIGAGITTVVVLGLAALAEPLREAAQISAPNLRIAAGLVLTVTGVLDLVRSTTGAVALPPGRRAAVVPVAFPVLLEPQVGVLALAAGADRGVVLPTVLAAAVLAVWVAATRLPSGLLGPLARLAGAVGVIAGTALMLDGVLSV